MRTISVKEGSSKYKLKSDSGSYLGELIITYDASEQTCHIKIEKMASAIVEMGITS